MMYFLVGLILKMSILRFSPFLLSYPKQAWDYLRLVLVLFTINNVSPVSLTPLKIVQKQYKIFAKNIFSLANLSGLFGRFSKNENYVLEPQ